MARRELFRMRRTRKAIAATPGSARPDGSTSSPDHTTMEANEMRSRLTVVLVLAAGVLLAATPLCMAQNDDQPVKDAIDAFVKTVSVPELITGPIPLDSRAIARAARRGSVVGVDGFTGASPSAGTLEPWDLFTR